MTLQQIKQISVNKSSAANFSDLVSLALHQLVVVRLRSNPHLIENAKSNLQKWLAKNPSVNAWLEWKKILETESLERLLEIIAAETEEGQRLRSSSPFVGIVNNEERKFIIEYCEKAKPKQVTRSNQVF